MYNPSIHKITFYILHATAKLAHLAYRSPRLSFQIAQCSLKRWSPRAPCPWSCRWSATAAPRCSPRRRRRPPATRGRSPGMRPQPPHLDLTRLKVDWERMPCGIKVKSVQDSPGATDTAHIAPGTIGYRNVS